MVRFGKTCQTPDDIVKVVNEFLQQADFPFEPPAARRCVKINQARDWFLDFEMIHIKDVFVYYCFFVGVGLENAGSIHSMVELLVGSSSGKVSSWPLCRSIWPE